MRLLIDAQLPSALCARFGERGVEAAHVRDTLGGQALDREIADHVEQFALVLLTKDDDFLLRHPPDRSRLIWLRCGNLTNRRLRAWLEARWPLIQVKLEQGEKVIEVRGSQPSHPEHLPHSLASRRPPLRCRHASRTSGQPLT